jgi:hypothetical protein
VDEQPVDPIDAEPFEAAGEDRLDGRSVERDIPARRDLGRDPDPSGHGCLALRQPTSHHPLAGAVGVALRGVEHVHAERCCLVERRHRRMLVQRRTDQVASAPDPAEAAATECDRPRRPPVRHRPRCTEPHDRKWRSEPRPPSDRHGPPDPSENGSAAPTPCVAAASVAESI